MHVDVLTVGMFQSNCFIVSCEATKEAIVIDAGDEGARIVDHVKRAKLDVKWIVCTHGHIDHVAGLSDVRAALATGVQSIAVSTGISTPEELAAESPHLLLEDLRSLPFERLF